jgi:hypothetical protein
MSFINLSNLCRFFMPLSQMLKKRSFSGPWAGFGASKPTPGPDFGDFQGPHQIVKKSDFFVFFLKK